MIVHAVKSKGKVVSVFFNLAPLHEGVLGSGGIAPLILWSRQGKNPQYPLDRRLGGSQSRSGGGGEEKNSQPPPGIEP
jgi:hypothetical protein